MVSLRWVSQVWLNCLILLRKSVPFLRIEIPKMMFLRDVTLVLFSSCIIFVYLLLRLCSI